VRLPTGDEALKPVSAKKEKGTIARDAKVEIMELTPMHMKFMLYDTDIEWANALRRVMMAEVPTMTIELVNVTENTSPLFDEFIAHRLGLLPLNSVAVDNYVDADKCTCMEGCPNCSVEYKLEVRNDTDKNLSVTHFDLIPINHDTSVPESDRVVPVPRRDPTLTLEEDAWMNGMKIAKLAPGQEIKMTCKATRGIGKAHAKFIPTATTVYKMDPIVRINPAKVAQCTEAELDTIVESCPQKVFERRGGDLVIADVENVGDEMKRRDCIFCDECSEHAKLMGQDGMVVALENQTRFIFTVESSGSRPAIDIVHAGISILEDRFQEIYALVTEEELRFNNGGVLEDVDMEDLAAQPASAVSDDFSETGLTDALERESTSFRDAPMPQAGEFP